MVGFEGSDSFFVGFHSVAELRLGFVEDLADGVSLLVERDCPGTGSHRCREAEGERGDE